jgi:hypothetical protein
MHSLPKQTEVPFAAYFAHKTAAQLFRADQRHAHFKSLAMIVLALALFVLSYVYGLNRGMDRLFAGPLDTRAQQIASAISDVAYNLDLRYAVHGKILTALTKGGMSDLPDNIRYLGLQSPDYFSDTALWNNLLNEVAHLQGITASPRASDDTLTFIGAEDLGLVDFFKLSFHLFGYNIQGFFKTYFLLLALGIVSFFYMFWSRPGILATANFLLLGLFLSIYRLDDIDSVSNGRFFATLAIFPTFHLMILTWAPPRITVVAAALATVQALLLAFVITMRSSAAWGVLLLGASMVIMLIWQAKILWSREPLKIVVQKSITWPIVIIAVGLIGYNVYQNNKIHPGYFALDETLPEHLFWHSLAYSLSFLPGIDALVPELQGARGDSLPTYLANTYLKNSIGFEPPSLSAYYSSNFFPDLGRPRTYERVVRAAYLDFARQHPIEFLRLTFVIKPQMLTSALVDSFARVTIKSQSYFLLSSLLVLVAICLMSPTPRDVTDLNLGTRVLGGMAIAASLPSLVAYPIYLGDTFAVWIALIAALLLVLAWNSRPLLSYIRR